MFRDTHSFCPSSLIFSSTACRAAASEALVSSIFWCTASTVTTPVINADPVELSMDTPLIEERGGFTGGGVGMGVGGPDVWGVWGVCGVWGVWGVCGVWGDWGVCGVCALKAGGVVALTGWLFWAEAVLAILVTVCLAGEGVGVGLGVAFKDCRKFLDGLGAVGGGVGFGEIGGGTFFPSTVNRREKR